MRTYYADIEDTIDRSSFLYRIDKETDQEAITHFIRVFGDRVEMICIKSKEKAIPVYQKPGLFETDVEVTPIDYRVLLKKYIDHIWGEEGITFLDRTEYNKDISDRDLEELLTLESEIAEGRKNETQV